MAITRRAFIASLIGAIAAPKLALPQPAPGMVQSVADDLVVQCSWVSLYPVPVRHHIVLLGSAAREAYRREPHLWSAVMVNRQLPEN